MTNDASNSSNQDSVCSLSLSSFSFSSFSFCEFESDLSGRGKILPCHILTSCGKNAQFLWDTVRKITVFEPLLKMLRKAIEIQSFADSPSLPKCDGFSPSLQVSHVFHHPAKPSLGQPTSSPKPMGLWPANHRVSLSVSPRWPVKWGQQKVCESLVSDKLSG